MRGGGYRGGRGGGVGYGNVNASRGYGGAYGGNPTGPTDTLNIRVTEVQQPVTEDDMRKVFDRAGVAARSIQIYPTASPSETVVMAQFPDQMAAERVMGTLNNLNIYTNANKMNMSFAPSSTSATPILGGGGGAPNVGGNGAVLSAPHPMYGGAPQQSGYMPMQQGNMMMPPPQMAPQMAPQMGMAPQYMNQMVNPMMMMDPMGGRGGGMGMRGGRGMGMRGGRGVGMRGGMNGNNMGFNPMMMGGAMPMGFNPMGMPMGRGGRNDGGMMMGGNQRGVGSTIFLSVTLVPLTEPLQSVFLLLEAFGGVVSMRRNQNKKEILTVKMASFDDAEAAVAHMRRVPFAGGTVSAIRFPAYVERHPCTDEGDPTDTETTQFDFTASRHRSPGQRSKANPSRNLKITGCAAYVESDIMAYLNDKNFFADSITKEEDGAFTVVMPDTETAVKVLIACHGNVCGEERSNVIFLEGPKEGEAEGDGQKATGDAKNEE